MMGVFCSYCTLIRDDEFIPIEIPMLSQWVTVLQSLINDELAQPIREELSKLIIKIKDEIPQEKD